MVRRHARASFGAAFAFPGGVVDAGDNEIQEYYTGISSATANACLGLDEGGLGYYSAAIRELFEETGVLLADLSSVDESLARVRDGLNDGSASWTDFLRRCAMQLRCDSLHYFSHWVTPPGRAKRYSTRFFLAFLPEGQVAEHCGGELTESRWITAKDMLAAGRRGDVELYYPTIKTLESVAHNKTLAELTRWAKSRAEQGVTATIPLIIQRNSIDQIVLPGDKDYPGAET
jgi:8-oxo-dGTP pyrophosphatase MutT (NUDIX family)